MIGAFLASLLFPRLGFHHGTGIVSEILHSAIGAIVLLLILRLVSSRGRLPSRGRDLVALDDILFAEESPRVADKGARSSS